MEDLLTPEQLCEAIPGTSKPYWAALRFQGSGPRYFKPSAKKVLYRRSDVLEWIENSARYGTAREAV